MNNIGSVYDNNGDYTKALQCYERCLDIKTKIKGNDSMNVATTLNNIGLIYEIKKDYSKALEYYEQCLDIETKIKWNNSINVAQHWLILV